MISVGKKPMDVKDRVNKIKEQLQSGNKLNTWDAHFLINLVDSYEEIIMLEQGFIEYQGQTIDQLGAQLSLTTKSSA